MTSFSINKLLPIFSGENYDYCAIQMKTYFISKKLWEIIEKGVIVASNSTPNEEEVKRLKEEKTKDAEALFYIQMASVESIFPRIVGAKFVKEAWETLKEELQGCIKLEKS
uniref:DUF4219 domain-containing protein n=1 Tax=Manihot esculenta TaxID=3983 RepID=A0A199U9V2_MANES